MRDGASRERWERAGALRRSGRIAIAVAAAAVATPPGGVGALDLAAVTPSSLLQAGQIEFKTFHSLYTQTASFDADGRRVDEPRSTYYTGILSVTAGTGGAWNPGVELTLRSVENDAFPAGTRSRTTLTAVQPRVQVAPFRGAPTLALETGFRVPVAHDLEGTARIPYLDWGDPIWVTRLLWDVRLRGNWTAWAEAGTQLRADLGAGDAQLTTPLQLLVSWWPHRDWTIYVPLAIAPDWIGDARGHYWSQVGLGLKMRPTLHVELEVLGTMLPSGRGAGAGRSLSVGLRVAP